MKNQSTRIILLGLLLLAVSCQAEISTSGTTTVTTSNAGPAEQTAGPTMVSQEESTTAPEETGTPAVPPTPAVPATPSEPAAPTETPAAESTPDMRRQALYGSLPAYLMNGDFETLETLMGERFAIIYWGSDGQTLTREEAVQELRDNLLPDPSAIRFTLDESLFPQLGDVDPTKVFGYHVKVVDLVFTGGWGADGQGEALLAIGLSPDGQYWPGMIYAPAGFEDGASQEGIVTYVNEHAGYAFDYPAGWIVQGEPRPDAFNYVIILRSFEMGQGPGPVPGDQVKMDFVTCNSAECKTLQALEQQIEEQVTSGMLQILSEEEWTLADGIPAIRRQVVGEMGIEAASLVTEIGGQSLQVGGFGDLSAFDEIARTLRAAGGQAVEGGLRARLEIPQTLPLGQPAKVQFFLVNDSYEDLYVLNWFTPLEGLGGDIFLVRRDGRTVRYQGPLAERAEPTPEAYTLIEAGEAVWAEVDLTRAYDFSVPGNYTLRFNSPRLSHIARSEAAMASTYGELGPIEIPSNEVTVTIEDGDRPSADIVAAQEDLVRYFSLLNEGQYADAVAFHGNGYEVLRDWNPSVDADDLAGLLERGCTVNGFRCLPVKSVTPQVTGDPNSFEFAIQFENPDGSPFVLNPEGDWPESTFPQSLFEFTVAKIGDSFVVQDPPVYAP